MDTIPETSKLARRSRWLPWAATLLALLLLAGAVLYTRNQLRQELRSQLARNQGTLLTALLQRQLSGSDATGETDPLLAVIETSILPELPGITAARLYDIAGRFHAALIGDDRQSSLPREAVAAVQAGRTVSRFLPASTAAGTPIVEILAPLRDNTGTNLLAIAQFELDGSNLAVEYEVLDSNLRRQARLAFVLAGTGMTLALAFAFRRLARANRLLADRTARLLRANHELTLAAKTSAVGAVTAHLIHGLKNPLAGLQQFVAAQGSNEAEGDWSDAADTTRRMKRMVDEVVRVLREDQGLAAYEVHLCELLELLSARFSPRAAERGVALNIPRDAHGRLANRDANLTLLVLENLLTNAIQATSRGGHVEVTTAVDGSHVQFRVCDGGPGLPSHVREHLFTPVRSTKEGGSGIGLAICRQLALHMSATLELEHSDASGTVFCIRLPLLQSAGDETVQEKHLTQRTPEPASK
jgi:signal transduction histidine kinase